MPYLVNIYFQAELATGSGKIYDTEEDAQEYAKETISTLLQKYPEQNQGWAESCFSSVITPVENVLLPNYNL